MPMLALLGDVLRLLFLGASWAIALGLLLAGIALLKRRHRVVGALFLPVSAFLFWMPFWGQFPGRMLAEKACEDIGGWHGPEKLPADVDSLYLPAASEVNGNTLVELLAYDGLHFIEHGANTGGRVWVYAIEPASNGHCLAGDALLERTSRDAGLRPDECIAHFQHAGPLASATYSETKEMHWSFIEPVTTQRFTRTKSGALLSSLTSFQHFQFMASRNPYGGFACHVDEYLRFKDPVGRVEGGPHPLRRPSRPLPSGDVESHAVFARTIPMERLDASVANLSAQDAEARRESALGMGDFPLRIWRPSHRWHDASMVAWWGDGAATTSVEIPRFSSGVAKRGVAEQSDTQPIDAGVRVLAAKTSRGRLLLIRERRGVWEISEFEVATRSWRRLYVDLADPDVVGPIVWKYNSFYPLVEAMNADAEGITVTGLSLRHDAGGPVGVDNGFRMSFPRP